MTPKIKFKIATAERVVYEDLIDQLSLPTPMGEITILPHHIHLISSVSPGEIVVKKEKEEVYIAISEGFVEVTRNNVIILADTAERAEEIDMARAEEAKERAEKLLEEKQVDAVEYAALSARIEKEFARMKVFRKRRRG